MYLPVIQGKVDDVCPLYCVYVGFASSTQLDQIVFLSSQRIDERGGQGLGGTGTRPWARIMTRARPRARRRARTRARAKVGRRVKSNFPRMLILPKRTWKYYTSIFYINYKQKR